MENLKLDDFTKYKFISGPKFSPEGGKLAFVLHKIDVEDNKYLSNIYIYDQEKKDYRFLTSGDSERSFLFKDGNTILFPGLREAKNKTRKEKGEDFTVFYQISLDGGEARRAFELPLNVGQMEFLDQDRLILTAVYDHNKPDLDRLAGEEREQAIKKLEEEKDYEVLDEIPFWFNGQGYTNKKRNRLYIYNLKDGSVKPITDEFTNVNGFKLNADKSQAVFVGSSFENMREIPSDLYLYHIEEERLERLNQEEVFAYTLADFLGNEVIYAGSYMENHGINENKHIYILDGQGQIKQISPKDFDFGLWSSVGSDSRYGASPSIKVDGDYLYFITTDYNSSYINRIDREGNLERVSDKPGSVDGFDVLNGELVFVGLKNLRLQELYKLEAGQKVQLTGFNDWVGEEKKLSTPERLTFKNKDGIEIEGWLMRPVDFDEKEKYPGILNIHGGPKTVYGDVFFHEMQYWANEGYAVFFCNPRGSDGRGNEFADIRGKYGTVDYEDLMEFTDVILEKYDFIDKDRLGVTGGSYGGFMTNWIIGHTDRFKAAASQRSISNWISKFGTTDIGYYFVEDQQAATPWSDVDKLWFHSPMKYADQATTPTLFIHSEEDYRCWTPEAIQMFTALKYHGVEARLCLFRGENHELSRSGKPKHRIRRLEEITDWFDKYLKED